MASQTDALPYFVSPHSIAIPGGRWRVVHTDEAAANRIGFDVDEITPAGRVGSDQRTPADIVRDHVDFTDRVGYGESAADRYTAEKSFLRRPGQMDTPENAHLPRTEVHLDSPSIRTQHRPVDYEP